MSTQKKTTVNKIDTKGNWEASFTQRGTNQLKEQAIKAQCPVGNFDPHMIDSMMDPKPSKEQLLLEKAQTKCLLTKREQIILANIREKEQAVIANDMMLIDKQGLNARPETDEGRMHLLFRYGQYYIDKDDDKLVYYTYIKINDILATNVNMAKVILVHGELYHQMEEIVKTLNCIELQTNDFHHNMPPLNEKGFVRLDDFQKQVICNIRKKRSMIVQAPTSAGKSILTSYIFSHTPDIKVLYVVATDILVWQVAAMIGRTLNRDIPMTTSTYKSNIELVEMLKLIHLAGIFVGTPSAVLDFLPLLKFKFDWVVVDEIHLIGSDQCKEMESIIKITSDSTVLALSATIGNISFLQDWFVKVGHDDIDVIECNKRFFNQQRFFYQSGKIIRIHPLSTITIDDIKNGSIKNINLMPTPPDIWDLAKQLNRVLPKEMKILNYFRPNHRITLDEINGYFDQLIHWMVVNVDKKYDMLNNVIESYKHGTIERTNYELYDVAVTLRDNDKLPGLAFQTDSYKCIELARAFSRRIRDEEEKSFPNLRSERMKAMKIADATEKKLDQKMVSVMKDIPSKSNDNRMDQQKVKIMKDKQLNKMRMDGTIDRLTEAMNVSLTEPHTDYIINKYQPFNPQNINDWYKEMKDYFAMDGTEYHYIIDLLWRGVGVYCKGLPQPYLHLIQNLACSGKLGFVFSDDSLVYGVSMPFRTVVITKDNNILSRNKDGEIEVDGMTYLQEVGRAGRRGLDKEGNTLHVNYTWEEIQKLVTCKIPHIKGCDTMLYCVEHAKMLSDNDRRWDKVKKNFLLEQITDEDSKEFYDGIADNLVNGWKFAVGASTHFQHMMWCFRHSEKGFRVAFILNEIRKTYKNCNPKNENTQIEFARLIQYYVVAKEAGPIDRYLMTPIQSANPMLRDNFETLGLDIPERIDGRVYEIIRQNSFIAIANSTEKQQLRDEIFDFGMMLQNIQHYFYNSKDIIIAKLIAKLMTRVWWNYHLSSPVMEPISRYVIYDN